MVERRKGKCVNCGKLAEDRGGGFVTHPGPAAGGNHVSCYPGNEQDTRVAELD